MGTDLGYTEEISNHSLVESFAEAMTELGETWTYGASLRPSAARKHNAAAKRDEVADHAYLRLSDGRTYCVTVQLLP